VERLLLPLELLGVAARGGLVGGEAPPAAEGEREDGLAQRRDGVLQARVVGRRVRVPHRRGSRRLSCCCLVVILREGGSCRRGGTWKECDLVGGSLGFVWFLAQRLGEELAVEGRVDSSGGPPSQRAIPAPLTWQAPLLTVFFCGKLLS
jgi:hypothetical protein